MRRIRFGIEHEARRGAASRQNGPAVDGDMPSLTLYVFPYLERTSKFLVGINGNWGVILVDMGE